jgi:hypothetical protein
MGDTTAANNKEIMQKYLSQSLFVTATKIMAIKNQQLLTKYDAQWKIKGLHLLIQRY